VLILAREIHHLRDFGFGHLERIDAAQSDTFMVNMQHNLRRILAIFVEEPFQDAHDEFHRRVVVVQKQDLVETWLLRLRPRFRDNAVRPSSSPPFFASSPSPLMKIKFVLSIAPRSIAVCPCFNLTGNATDRPHRASQFT
jgi:hypothetical protein